MRLLISLSGGLLISFFGGAAVAAPPTTVFDVGSFQSAKIARDADAATIDNAARVVLAERVSATKNLAFAPSQATALRDGRRIVKLQQMHAGLPVVNRSATITFDANGVAHIVAAKLANDLPTDITPSVDATTAAATATQHAHAFADPQAAQLVIWPSGDGERLAWRFYTPSMGLPYAPITVVDAKTGSVLAHYNAAVSFHQANVYPSNPVKSPMLVSVTLPLPDGATTLTDEFVSAKNCIDTKMLTPIPDSSTSLHLCDLQQTAVADPMTFDFNDKPAADTKPEDPFAELHLYHHTRAAYDYFRTFDPTFKVQDAPIDVVANLMQPADDATAIDPNIPLAPYSNAFFTSGGLSIYGITGAALMFGQGPLKDYAYDADVIYHEFTHAVIAATVGFVGTAHHDKYGLSLSPSAMSEGIADYFAAVISGDPDIGEYAALDRAPEAKAFRSLTNPDSCPSAIGGDEHQDATLFSGSLWDVRSKLAVDVQPDFDLSIFSALKAAPSGDIGYDEFANVIIEQVKMAPTLGMPVATQLTEAFTNRGVLPMCARIIEYGGKPMVGPLDLDGAPGVWIGIDKGRANLGSSKIAYAPGVIQMRVPLPENTNSITVKFRAASLDKQSAPFSPRVLIRIGDDPIEFTLSPLTATTDATHLVPQPNGSEDAQGFRAWSVKADVMPGAKTAYAMIANSSYIPGVYTDVEFAMTQASTVSGSGGNPEPVATEDCGCTVPGSSTAPIGISVITLATLAGMFGRRRRSKNRVR